MEMTEILIAAGAAAALCGIVALLLGLFLGFAGNAFKVEVDEREEAICGVLPGNNCGGCGYAGCSGMAEALVTGEVKKASQCKPSKEEARQNIIKYLGLTLLPQAGVAIGMAQVVSISLGGETAEIVTAVVLCATLIYELFGPVITKIALKKAGEIQAN